VPAPPDARRTGMARAKCAVHGCSLGARRARAAGRRRDETPFHRALAGRLAARRGAPDAHRARPLPARRERVDARRRALEPRPARVLRGALPGLARGPGALPARDAGGRAHEREPGGRHTRHPALRGRTRPARSRGGLPPRGGRPRVRPPAARDRHGERPPPTSRGRSPATRRRPGARPPAEERCPRTADPPEAPRDIRGARSGPNRPSGRVPRVARGLR
jgi:hypothetical protein